MNDEFGYGYQGPGTASSDYNVLAFIINQILGRVRTCLTVKVISAPYGGGGVGPVGFVDVQPTVNMLDGLGNSQAHGTVYTLPYFRLQGGTTGAVICDPKVGDIGFALICDRDISAVKQNRAQANPGSWRRFSLADGIYVGGILNGTPTTYIQLDGAGNINIIAPASNTIIINGGTVKVHASQVYEWDCYGYGVKVSYEGGNVWQVDNYTTAAPGQTVTTNNHDITPPGPP